MAFTVCQHFGIETSDYSFVYIAGWSKGKEMPELKASLDVIRKAASEMITEIEGHLQERMPERAAQEAAAEIADTKQSPGLQENGLYRYYSTQRPVDPGTFPQTNQKPVNIENYNSRIMVENDTIRAWGIWKCGNLLLKCS